MMTHEELRQRRAEIAAFVANGESIPDAAEHFQCDAGVIYRACHAHGVVWKRWQRQGNYVHPFQILALLRDGKTLQAIGDEVGLARERVRQIKDEAVEFGVLDWVDRRL